MRSRALAGVLAVALAACATRDQPYRFGSPMLGMADVPPPPLGRPEARPLSNGRDPMPPEGPRASAEAAASVARAPARRALARLPATHRLPREAPLPAIRAATELRALVGRRDGRGSLEAALSWVRELGGPAIDAPSGDALVAWAEARQRRLAASEAPLPGDLLVFDRATSEDDADLVAIAIARDARGVTEVLYVGGGVVRRGFVDASRPALRRDPSGAVVNTFVRHGKRRPPRGTRYLAGELLAHVIRTR